MEQVRKFQVNFINDNSVHVIGHKGLECTITVKKVAGRILLSSNEDEFKEVPKYVKEYIKKTVEAKK